MRTVLPFLALLALAACLSPLSLLPKGPSVAANVQADAINQATGAKVAGTASVMSATRLRYQFDAGSLSVGRWSLQLLATPPGESAQIVDAAIWIIRAGAAA